MRQTKIERKTSFGMPHFSRVFRRGRAGRAKGRAPRFFSHVPRAILIYASILLQIGVLRGAPVGDSQARRTAAAYVARNYAPASVAKAERRLASPAVLAAGACSPLKVGQAPVGYVVELVPSGFVVMRADDALPPVKLHSATGSYGALPAGFRAVIEAELAGEAADLADLQRARKPTAERFRRAWKALAQAAPVGDGDLALAPAVQTAEAGAPLLATAWNQTTPYNYYAPAVAGGSGGRALAGCGAVAMAQILRYHEAPAAPVVDFSYTDSAGGCVGLHRISDAGGLGEYEWSNMPAALTVDSSLAQKQAVGRLMSHCGVAMEMDYEANSASVISQLTTARAFRDVFGYQCEEYQFRSGWPTETWFAKIQGDVDGGSPVYYTMESMWGGHALVCDGYRNGDEIHLNFGISGYGDAWYNIDSVYFHGATWSQHAAVFGITPQEQTGTNTLNVVNGTGGGEYPGGTAVGVAADEPQDGFSFLYWRVSPASAELGAGFVPTQAVTVLTMPHHRVTLTAVFKAPNRPPAVTLRSPASDPAAVSEGASVAFRLTANDSGDPDAEARGMSNICWYVDGLLKQTTASGAPGAVSSAFTLRTDAGTVRGEASREVAVRAVAADRQGGVTETSWTVLVRNVPAAQAITFRAQPVLALGATNVYLGATASSGLPVAYASANEAVARVVDGGQIEIMGAGATVITASQPGDFDFKAATPVRQTLTVRVRLAAEVPDGGGSVTGAGLYAPGARVALTARAAAGSTFLCWEDGLQTASRTVVVPLSNITVQAWFGTTTNVPPPVVGVLGAQQAVVGVFWRLPLEIQSESLPAVTVTGLPAGLRYNAAARAIEGVPSVAVAGRAITVLAKNVNRTAAARSFTLDVERLPAWAQGSFGGVCVLRKPAGLGVPALADLTVSPLGKISGKFAAEGTNYTFAAGSYTNAATFAFTAVASAGKVRIPLAVTVTHPEVYEGGPAALGAAQLRLGTVPESDEPATLWRNVWKDADMVAAATNYTGYYTATLPGGPDCGSGYLLFTVDKAGGVKVAGKLADGTAVSLSRALTLDAEGEVSVACHTTPSSYKGGCFHLSAAFLRQEGEVTRVRVANTGLKLWESRNPQATGDYAAGGFNRYVEVAGGWYDTVGNLYRYYAGRTLEVDTAGGPTPTLAVGTNRYESAWWNPSGLALTAVTNRYGVLTGFAAPKASVPVRVGGAYDYAGAENAVGLTMALNRATGVFKGSFKAWFDYGATHTARTLAYEGALTPETGDDPDGVAGRGFFLWADNATYLSAQNRPVTYVFNGSYDFLILAE